MSPFPVPEIPNLVIGVLLVGIGVAVAAARPRDPANFFFGTFLGLVGAGYVLDTVTVLVELRFQALQRAALVAGAGDADLAGAWRSVVFAEKLDWTVFLLDPFFLLYFASVYPRRNRLHRARVLVPFAATALLLLAVELASASPVPSWEIGTGDAFTALGRPEWTPLVHVYFLSAYVLAWWGLAGDLISSPGEVARARGRLLVLGLGTAVFARVGLLAEAIPPLRDALLGSLAGWPAVLVLRFVELGIALFACLAGYAALTALPSARGNVDARWCLRWTLVLLGAYAAVFWLLAPLLTAFGFQDPSVATWQRTWVMILERSRFGARWLLFGVIVGYSILRYQLFDLHARARRLTFDAVVGAGSFGAFAIAAYLAFSLAPRGVTSDPLVAFLLAAGASVVLVRGFDAIRARSRRVLAGMDPGTLWVRKLEVYRAAVENALERRGQEGALEALRLRLEIPEEEARAVERIARAPAKDAPLAPGAVVGGRYEVERLLGRGGAGRAFLAHDALLRRRVVLKEVLTDGDERESGALQEARIAGALAHPNVVTIHDVLRRPGAVVLVAEHVAGGSLADRLVETGPLPAAEALRIMDGVLAGLEAVHAAGVVHRDLKPSNVLLTADGTPKLADFGIARPVPEGTRDFETAGAFAGTPAFMAPEQRRGERATPAVDVYAAGRLLDAVTAKPIPATLAGVLARALAEGPGDRWASAAEMRAALADARSALERGYSPASKARKDP